jgi:hypothetical protein
MQKAAIPGKLGILREIGFIEARPCVGRTFKHSTIRLGGAALKQNIIAQHAAI